MFVDPAGPLLLINSSTLGRCTQINTNNYSLAAYMKYSVAQLMQLNTWKISISLKVSRPDWTYLPSEVPLIMDWIFSSPLYSLPSVSVCLTNEFSSLHCLYFAGNYNLYIQGMYWQKIVSEANCKQFNIWHSTIALLLRGA